MSPPERTLGHTLDLLERGRSAGSHLGGQIYVSIDRECVVDRAFGEVRAGEPMTSEHLMLWLSSAKPVAAVAVARLWEAGRLDLDDPIARHIPEFGTHGKETVTSRSWSTARPPKRHIGGCSRRSCRRSTTSWVWPRAADRLA